jgi:hypothetical protein
LFRGVVDKLDDDFHEVFRYERGGVVRVYGLRSVTKGAELWVTSEQAGEVVNSQMETAFSDSDEARPFLEEVERALTAGGWRRA